MPNYVSHSSKQQDVRSLRVLAVKPRFRRVTMRRAGTGSNRATVEIDPPRRLDLPSPDSIRDACLAERQHKHSILLLMTIYSAPKPEIRGQVSYGAVQDFEELLSDRRL
jgi:hypothetical protein